MQLPHLAFHKTLPFVLFGAVLWMSGCGKSSPATDPSATLDQAPVARGDSQRPAVLEVPTEQASQAFAEAFEAAVYRSDPSTVTRMIAWDTLMGKVTEGIQASESFQQKFIQNALTSKNRLASQLSQAVAKGGSFRLLRVYSKDNEQRALFRLLQSQSVKYQEFILGEDESGEVLITDMYSLLSAERMSRTIRRAYLLAAAEQPSNPITRVIGRDNDFIVHANEYRQLAAHVHAGQHQAAIDVYRSLPPTLQVETQVMLLYVEAASKLDDELYASAIEEFRTRHPEDAAVDMRSLDGFVLREQYARALEAVSRVDEWVGGDPYLNVLRANICIMQGEFSLAESFAQRAASKDPQLIDAYWSLVTVSLARPNFQDTARWLTDIREKFGIEFEDLGTISDYDEFVKSEEYREWLESGP